jgi:magnesium transporter
VYGMNFEYMPELQWPNGYFIVMAIMALMALVMLLFFRRKNWL